MPAIPVTPPAPSNNERAAISPAAVSAASVPSAAASWAIQVGSYTRRVSAHKAAIRARRTANNVLDLMPAELSLVSSGGLPLWRVRFGQLKEQEKPALPVQPCSTAGRPVSPCPRPLQMPANIPIGNPGSSGASPGLYPRLYLSFLLALISLFCFATAPDSDHSYAAHRQ